MVISVNDYLAILAALAAERLFELALSRRNARRALKMGAMEMGAGHYPVMAIFHALFVAAAAAEVIVFKRPFPGALGWSALFGALAAQGLRYWSVATLGARWNTRIVAFPDMPPVTSGPYRFMRHPNYLAVIVEVACIPLIHGCWLTAAVFSAGNAALLLVRIHAEEAALGPAYARLLGAKPRLIPALRPVARTGPPSV